MAASIITTEDLHEFKVEILGEFKELLSQHAKPRPKKWIRSMEVMKMYGISAGTLQNLRNNGTVPFARMGGVLYYDNEEISLLLERTKTDGNS